MRIRPIGALVSQSIIPRYSGGGEYCTKQPRAHGVVGSLAGPAQRLDLELGALQLAHTEARRPLGNCVWCAGAGAPGPWKQETRGY